MNSLLIVEDDQGIRDLLSSVFEIEGLACESCADGRAALAFLAQQRPLLVLLDLGLPYVDGLGVADGLRALHGTEVPIVLMTAEEGVTEKGRRVGAVATVHKPFHIGELLQAVRGALAS